MQTFNRFLPAVVLGSLTLVSVGAIAQSANTPTTGDNAANSMTNQRDRSNTVQPTDQSNSKPDIKVAASIRRAIVADRSLSSEAHNVKLVANGGDVILRGPVASDAEKQKVEQIAKNVVGVKTVENDLDVRNNNH